MAIERVDRHREKMNNMVNDEITRMFEKVLDYAEVAVPNGDQYKKLRSKILRVGNNCIRNIQKDIEKNYDVKYRAQSETIIEVLQK
ncbi:MAG: hypothetical protein WC346_08780 [Methanogenium sp.]|jgi:hypothetical protein